MAIFLAPYFLRPIDAATAPGLRTPLRRKLRLRLANRLPEPSFALRRLLATARAYFFLVPVLARASLATGRFLLAIWPE